MADQATTPEQVMTERARVVDHWKRLFSILVGFAITVACQRAYACWLSGDASGLVQFVILIVTIPPIFHGMERSLDVRYLQGDTGNPSAVRLILDTTTLVVTGLFLLALALSIPTHEQPDLGHDGRRRDAFFLLLFLFFILDSALLGLASQRFESSFGHRRAHRRLASLNIGVAGALGLALVVLCGPVLAWVSAGIAIARSIADYVISREFLYPQAPRGAAREPR